MRDLINVRLQGKKSLRGTVSSHCSCDWQVRIRGIGTKCIRLCPVEAQCFMARTACHGETAHAYNHRVTETPGREFFLPAVFDAHRLTRIQRQCRGYWFQHHLLFAAKATSHTRFDDSDARDR